MRRSLRSRYFFRALRAFSQLFTVALLSIKAGVFLPNQVTTHAGFHSPAIRDSQSSQLGPSLTSLPSSEGKISRASQAFLGERSPPRAVASSASKHLPQPVFLPFPFSLRSLSPPPENFQHEGWNRPMGISGLLSALIFFPLPSVFPPFFSTSSLFFKEDLDDPPPEFLEEKFRLRERKPLRVRPVRRIPFSPSHYLPFFFFFSPREE